jgi:tetratricopeptide (TPR) repeat protein
MNTRIGRNELCPCGSGRKYKHCHGAVGAEAQAAVALDPRQIGALVGLIQHGRPDQAEAQAHILLRRHADAGMLWKVLSVAQLRQGKDALAALRRAAALLPEDPEAHANLGAALYEQQRFSEALISLERSLALAPGNGSALIDAANTLRALARPADAVALYERALAIEPHAAEAHNNLGNAYFALRRFDEAAGSYRRALAERGKDASIHSNLASALQQLGRHEEALESTRAAIALEPGLAAAYNHQGLALAGLGRRREAIASLRRAVTLNPGYLEATTNLAELLREVGDHAESLTFAHKALELAPERTDGHYSLGNVLFEMRKLTAAADSFRRALELDPHNLRARLGLAATLRVRGQHDEAQGLCQAALGQSPESVEALALLGELRADRGQFAEAQELFARAMAIDPQYPSLFSSIATHRRMTQADGTWLAGVTRLLAGPLPLANEIGLRFALGKYYDDTGRYHEAFENYRLANELTARDGQRYEPARLQARVDRSITLFDAASIGRRAAHGSDSEVPVFIVGMPRSGTTLTEQIIASHPQAFGAGEVRFWDRAFSDFEELGAEAGRAQQLLHTLARDYLERLTGQAGGALRVTDKMPANFLYAGLIHAVFPRARIIHLRRHPLDTCLSIYFQNFFNMATYGRDLGNLAHYYGEYVRITDHWRQVLPPEVLLEVPYEALVQDQEGWTRRMLEFIGLPWDPRCLDFQDTDRVVITASRWQVRQRITAASVGRWRRYAKHLAPLEHLVPDEWLT